MPPAKHVHCDKVLSPKSVGWIWAACVVWICERGASILPSLQPAQKRPVHVTDRCARVAGRNSATRPRAHTFS
eukprot:366230-Chlamydomonas_euryale.AAC.10